MKREETGNGTRASSNRNEVTLGIMGEQVKNIEGSILGIKSDIKDLAQKIDDKYITRGEHEGLQQKVTALEDNQKWIIRLVVGAVVSAVIGFVIISQ